MHFKYFLREQYLRGIRIYEIHIFLLANTLDKTHAL